MSSCLIEEFAKVLNIDLFSVKGPGSTLFPSGGPPGTPEDIAAAASGVSLSPLQRMASITNSLVTQNSMAGGGGHGNRPLRAVLPPITQQQFDQFSHLNTDETVRRVSTEKTSKMNFTNNRLTSLRIFKLRAYLEKLIGRWYGYSGWSGLYDGQGSQGGRVNWVVRVV